MDSTNLRPDALDAQVGPRRRTVRACVALALFGLTGGCGMFAKPPPPAPAPPPAPPPPPPPPPKLSISIVAGAKLNPDSSGRASPVVVRLYELKSATAFASADFMSLFEQDKNVLASDTVVREEFTMQPGETKIVSKPLAPETRVIGLMAVFRDIERAQWRGVATLAPGLDNSLSIEINEVAVKMMKSARPVSP